MDKIEQVKQEIENGTFVTRERLEDALMNLIDEIEQEEREASWLGDIWSPGR